MARFLCAVHAPDATARAFALVEVMDDGPTYALRDLRAVEDFDAIAKALASEPQYAGQTTVVASGGQKAVDAIHEHGPSGVAVHLGTGAGDAHDVSHQELADTFERLFRAGAIDLPGSLDGASDAASALHAAADLEAAAPDSDRDESGDLDDDGASDTMAGTTVQGDGPSPSVVEQSGSAANVSTETIEAPVTADEASAAAVDSDTEIARTATDTTREVELSDDLAISLALACWYGETSRDTLPQTDKADEAMANRVNRPDRRN